MKHPGLVLAGQLPDRARNGSCRQRTTILIGIECHALAALRRSAHIFDETSITVLRRPSRQDDANHGVAGILQHQLIRFMVPTSLAIEDFAARQEDKGNVLGESSQIRRGVHIDTASELGIFLAVFRSTYSRAVDDCARFEMPPSLFDSGAIREIEVSSADTLNFLVRRPT